MDLSGRRIVITGAARGLGRALAIAASDLGGDLVLIGRDSAALHAVAGVTRARSGREASIVRCDLGVPDSVSEGCRAVLAATPVVDVLVNNAAPWLAGPISESSEAQIEATISAAVTGTILATRGLLPGLVRSRAPDIVTVVSTAGWPGWEFGAASAAFHAAKHGQSGFSDALRREVKDQGVRVTTIYPPGFDDLDPLGPAWYDGQRSTLTSRDIVETILFAITAPRARAYPVIILDAMGKRP